MPDTSERLRLGGVLAATVTPFTPDGAVDQERLGSYLCWLVDQGVHAVVVHADSGEGHALTPDERQRIAVTAAEAVAGRVPVIAGLIAQSTAEAVRLATADREAGTDALLVFPPISFLGAPLPPSVPVGYHRALADEVGMPMVAFQLQSALGGVEYTREALDELLALDAVVAIKESTFDAYRFRSTMQLVRERHPDVAFLSGNDNFIYESLVLGADGCLVGFGTVACREQVEMFEAVQARDYDRGAKLAERIEPLVRAVFAPPLRDYRARLKHVLTLQGVLASTDVRPPLTQLPADDADAVEVAAAVAGLREQAV